METDPRDRDPRVCSACGEPVDGDGQCAAMRIMLAGIEDLSTGGGQRAV